MNARIELTTGAREFLEKAYLHKPVIEFNVSSLGVFEEDIDAHEAFDFGDFRRLVRLGYVRGVEDRTWEISGRQVDVAIFQLTPLGLQKAQEILDQRRRVGLLERIHRANWSMVGGIAAIIAALASIAGAIFAFEALR